MKLKIEIKHWITGSLLFEYEAEDNTIMTTVKEAVRLKKDLRGADLSGADLRGADLRGADLTGADLTGAYPTVADLTGADLRGAYMSGAYMSVADLTGAYLTGAYLTGAYMSGAYMSGADLRGAYLTGYKVKVASVFTGLYKYLVIPFVTEVGEKRIVMGCHNRSLAEWEEKFWNNPSEFPNDNSEASNLRLFAFDTAKKWFELIKIEA